MVVGANQPTLLAAIRLLFADPALVAETGTDARDVTAGHGRIERRERWASAALAGSSDWPGLAPVLWVERTRRHQRPGRQQQERAYAVTSLAPQRAAARALLPLWREHWLIENRLHWVRDVPLGEDASRVRSGAAPQVLAVLRNTMLNSLRAHGYTEITAARRRRAARPYEALAMLGLGAQ